MYRQGNPYCIQVEFVEGCNLRCTFCGLNGIRGKDNNYKMMTLETAERVASEMKRLKWNSRLEFAMHGEPTMNPAAPALVRTFRQHLPKAYLLMESNGGGIIGKNSAENVKTLFSEGLTTLAFDEYQNVKLVPKILDSLMQMDPMFMRQTGDVLFEDDGFPVVFYDYPSCGNAGNPHQRNKVRRLVHIRPIDVSTSGTHASLGNHAGAGAPKNDRAMGKRCAKPFREMSIRWDGSVSICCNDWRGEMPVGNVHEMDLDEIWHSDRFYAARHKLYHGQRDFGACDGCDHLSYRPGILPDHLGKEELPEPSADHLQVIEEMLKEGPLTEPVLRPWEF
ncbi:MAG: hypothetical protein Tp138OMZ00d2C19078261_47 [Prokaryotic dsDNA virus sp.]|jgi:radical SAM protein with 4Fe4S-binding SPASM domain|nr:MAG: hypothetical protein Tp138OMZ00d2C19078261_47 [Prokaryotic dsDNA virus sp.]|tara:strand:- start:33241 stop:34245 length:1005 start_codon:yes stop_codon:yes gene_type:complete